MRSIFQNRAGFIDQTLIELRRHKPLRAGNNTETRTKVRKQIAKSAWEIEQNVKESGLSALSRRYLLREIDRIVAREMESLEELQKSLSQQ